MFAIKHMVLTLDKTIDSALGFFSQWIIDGAIFMIGMVINVYKGFPKFYPLAMLGGMFWAIGELIDIHFFFGKSLQ